MTARLTADDMRAVQAFTNFLTWGAQPGPACTPPRRRDVPPAWFAYAMGLTQWCPPAGEW